MAKKARKPSRKGKRSSALKSRKPKKRARAKSGKARRRTAARRPAKRRAASKRAKRVKAETAPQRHPPSLERERKRLLDVEETVPTPPSSLNMDRHGSAARSGRAALAHARHAHTQTSPAMTGGDVDADWEDAYAVGDEAPGGDNPTPDQDRVDDIGRALGIEYADNEELKASDKIAARDKRRWELDPASAEDYPDHEE